MIERPNDIKFLKALIGQHLGKIAQLEAENTKLRGRLGMDSNNRDKSPSSDGNKKKTVKPDLPKDKEGSQGGQKGHKGNPLKQVE